MNILLCPDKFKGSISAKDICKTLSAGILERHPTASITAHPMADGGDGSLVILQDYLQLKPRTLDTVNAVGHPIQATYYHDEQSAHIEMASAAGLAQLPPSDRNPMHTSTYGLGLMIRDAIHQGFKRLYLYIGGSATNDGGIGLAEACGYQFFDEKGGQLKTVGSNLRHIQSIQYDEKVNWSNLSITVLCDVENPMYGPNGAAHVYARQKGAKGNEIDLLDEGLRNYAEVLSKFSGKDVARMSGIGAAGAVSASLVGLMHAELNDGFSTLSNITDLPTKIQQADLVITGEGKIDATSFQGKVVGNVIQLCKTYRKSYGLIAGQLDLSGSEGIDPVFQYEVIALAKSVEDAMEHGKKYLRIIGAELIRW